MLSKKTPSSPNISLIVIFFILIVFGLIMLASASSVIGYTNFSDNYYYFKHQLLYGFLPGLILFFLCAGISYKFWQKNAGWLLMATFILLILVFIPGIGAHYQKAHSWINIGGFSLQPSEIAKLTLLIYLAAWFSKSREHVKSLSHGLLPFLILLGLLAGLIAAQPDFGTMFIIALLAMGVYFIAGAKISHLFGLLVVAVGLLALSLSTASYRLNRIIAFLKPETDLQGIGYHVSQALLAVGSGGILGLGLGKSRQKFEYLPEVAGDSIFAIIAEELGFVLCVIFIILLTYFIIKILKISQLTSDNFVKLFSAGLAIWIGGQALINISAMLGILPLTGVPLPFVSYGGTALIALMAGCGILINMTRTQKG